MATRSQLIAIVAARIEQALRTADRIELSANYGERYAATKGMVADLPKYRSLALGSAEKAWAAILFVDLRGSTARAQRVGARDTFVTMHAMLPALAHLVGDQEGFIVGFRGDGLFAAFGIDASGQNPAGYNQGKAVQQAASCGQTMLEGIEDVVNPALDSVGISGDLAIGVGVDVGEVVITRIGLPDAAEVTAYGNAVNRASKLSAKSNNTVLISSEADDLFPAGPNGRVTTELACAELLGYSVTFPAARLLDQ